TTGEMRVIVDPENDLALSRAGAVEALSAHPIAEAIAERVGQVDNATAFVRHPGRGAEAVVDGTRILVGSTGLFAAEEWPVPDPICDRVEALQRRGLVPVVVGWDGAARDVIGVGDEPRPGWEDLIETLGATRTVAILTGDDDRATAVFRDHPAVDHVLAGLPPEGKAEAVSRLRSNGPVAMVGDGTNDAPAMAAADLGVAIGTGAALTTDAADVVLTRNGLVDLEPAFGLATTTRRRIRENLAWAFLYNGVAIPAALLGVLDPLVAAGAMATSSLLVVINSARPISPKSKTSHTAGPGERDRSPGGRATPEAEAVHGATR
ncbi:MAG: HAD-IC family P-type ATPase, partial [Halobacteriales archaeon]|nr:HAD-IC family P-type ATPase [Halobacteriales archaeon]